MGRTLMMTSALALALVACKPAATGSNAGAGANNSASTAENVAAKKAIEDTEAGMLAAFKAKDAAKLTTYFGDDSFAATPGRRMLGIDAIRKGNTEDLADPGFDLNFQNEKTDVAASGDLGYTRGSFDVRYTDKATKKVRSEKGVYVTVFKKQADGSWKDVADLSTPTG